MPVHWNGAAEELLHEILQRTPRPQREAAEAGIRAAAESYAEENGLGRIGVPAIIAGYIKVTPETLRPDLPRQFEALGLDAADYGPLLEG